MSATSLRVGALLVGLAVALAGCKTMDGTLQALDNRPTYQTFSGPMIKRLSDPGEPPTPTAETGERHMRLNGYGIVRNPEMTAYANAVLARVMAVAPGKPVPARVVLTAAEGFSATTTPDGVIGVPVEFLALIDSEDELAGLLAHEYAHVRLGHHGTDWFQRSQEHLVALGEIAFALNQKFNKKAAGKASGVKALIGSTLAEQLTAMVISPTWGRQQEDEADLLGLDLAIAAGYNADGFVDVVRKTEQWLGEQQKREAEARNLAGQRAQLEQAMNEKGQRLDFNGMTSILGEAITLELGAAFKEAGKDHRTSEERLKALAGYREREYEDLVPIATTTQPVQKLRAKPAVRDTLALYRSSFDALRRLHTGQLVDEGTVASLAQRGVRGGHPLPAILYHEFAGNRGSEATLRGALAFDELPMEAYLVLHRIAMRHGDRDAAGKWLDDAWQRYGEPSELLPTLVEFSTRIGKKDRASLLALRCQAAAPGLRRKCMGASRV